jgi:hypothetical protein
MKKLESFLASEIERLKDELNHLESDHKKITKAGVNKLDNLISVVRSREKGTDNTDILDETINAILKNGEMAGRIKEAQNMIKRFTKILQTIKKDEE